MSAQDVKWIVIASVLLVSFSLWVGAHSPAPNQNSTRMASLPGSVSSARSLPGSRGAVVPSTGDSWHSPAELALLKADAIRLDNEERDMAKPVPYDASQGFDPQSVAASIPPSSGSNASGPDPNGVGYDYSAQVRNADTGYRSPSDGAASPQNQSAGDRYFNPYDPANYYPPGYTPSGNGPSSGRSDNDNSSSDNQEDFDQGGDNGSQDAGSGSP